MKKFQIYLAIFLLFLIITTFTCLNHFDSVKIPEQKQIAPEIVIEDEKITADDKEVTEKESENTPASTDIKHITKYILKYDNDEVVLISRFDDGKETSNPMPDININYLTEIDIEHLKQGIELDSEEKLFKLIEDYSS